MRKLIVLAVMLALLVPVAAPAQDTAFILQARRAGQIGERYDGYLGFVVTYPSDELRRQVSAINIRRRALYSRLATQKGATPEEVGITAACTLLRRINAGEYYLPGQGGWARYAVGRSPVPTYCG